MLMPMPVQTKISLTVVRDDAGCPTFKVSAEGFTATGDGLPGALQELGIAMYRRRTALSKLHVRDLSEKALNERQRLEEILGKCTIDEDED